MRVAPLSASPPAVVRSTNGEQLLLEPIAEAWQIRHRLFLALVPDAATATRLADLAHCWRAKHNLLGRPLLAEHFHVSLYLLDEGPAQRRSLVEATRAAMARVRFAPFDVTFDRAMSFRRHQPTQAYVLRNTEPCLALHEFHGRLGDALIQAGLGRYVRASFTPHITLLYDEKRVEAHAITWSVRELVLVDSLVGQTRHIHLERWPLRA